MGHLGSFDTKPFSLEEIEIYEAHAHVPAPVKKQRVEHIWL